MSKLYTASIRFLLIIFLLLASFESNYAIPSFTRQTGVACSDCHTTFPMLNAFGRQFKLNAYTMITAESLESKDKQGQSMLLQKSFPLSALIQTSYTHISKTLPGTQNDYFALPQQMSLFLAGEITPKVGAFMQITYSQVDGAIGMDNTEIRYADNTTIADSKLDYGLTLNNNPGVSDLWHTLPAWGFPYASSAITPGALSQTLLEGGLAGKSIGLGVYGLWNNWIYGEIAPYRSAFQGKAQPFDATVAGVIKGLAPYWRLAVQHPFGDHYISVGAFGLMANTIPSGISGPADNYSDIGGDLQYEYTFGKSTLALYGSYIMENQKLNRLSADSINPMTMNISNTLNSMRFTATYSYNCMFSASLGYFSLKGSADSTLYSGGSLNWKPDTGGIIAEIACFPWMNTRFSLQYYMFNSFNGASANYDGSNRDASHNNTIHLLAWIMF